MSSLCKNCYHYFFSFFLSALYGGERNIRVGGGRVGLAKSRRELTEGLSVTAIKAAELEKSRI